MYITPTIRSITYYYYYYTKLLQNNLMTQNISLIVLQAAEVGD